MTLRTFLQVKSVFARQLSASVDENKLMEIFGKYGNIEKIKKMRDYAFIHYEERSEAEKVAYLRMRYNNAFVYRLLSS